MKADGMNYAPKGKPRPVVGPGEFFFSAMALDHGHIYGMCNGLIEAGATLKYVYDPDPDKVARFLKAFPQAIPAQSKQEVLSDQDTRPQPPLPTCAVRLAWRSWKRARIILPTRRR